MEHDGNGNDDDYMKEFLNTDNQGDFDSRLEGYSQGWKNQSKTESEILDSQKVTPTPIKTAKDLAEDAADSSESNTSSPETQDAVVSNESSNAQDAASSEVSSTEDEEVETPKKRKLLEREIVEHHVPTSDPAFSQSIIDNAPGGKVAQHTVRGIKTGPWANQQATQNVQSGEAVLAKLGFPTYSELWAKDSKFWVRLATIEKVTERLNKLELLIFRTSMKVESGKEKFRLMLADLSGEERRVAEEEYSKIYREKSARAHPARTSGDGTGKKRAAGNGEVKAVKAPKLAKTVSNGIDTMIALGTKFEQLVEMTKQQNPPDIFLRIEYIKSKFNKA